MNANRNSIWKDDPDKIISFYARLLLWLQNVIVFIRCPRFL